MPLQHKMETIFLRTGSTTFTQIRDEHGTHRPDKNDKFQTSASLVYDVKGKRLCRLAFARLTNISEQIVSRHAELMFSSPSSSLYESNLRASHLGCLRPHDFIVNGFLNFIFERYR